MRHGDPPWNRSVVRLTDQSADPLHTQPLISFLGLPFIKYAWSALKDVTVQFQSTRCKEKLWEEGGKEQKADQFWGLTVVPSSALLAMSASPENLVGMQILRLHPDLLKENREGRALRSCFKKPCPVILVPAEVGETLGRESEQPLASQTDNCNSYYGAKQCLQILREKNF